MQRKYLVIPAIIVLLAGCYGSNIIYNAEKTKGVDYSRYKTYAFIATKDTGFTQMVDRKNLERNLGVAVKEELSKHGMIWDTLHPDCLFTYTLVMNKTYELGQKPPEVYNPQAYAPMYAGQATVNYYIPYSYSPTPSYDGGMAVTTFRDGSLVIDMIDPATNKIIWRTGAQGKTEENSRKGIKATINEIVPQMFKKFPVKH